MYFLVRTVTDGSAIFGFRNGGRLKRELEIPQKSCWVRENGSATGAGWPGLEARFIVLNHLKYDEICVCVAGFQLQWQSCLSVSASEHGIN